MKRIRDDITGSMTIRDTREEVVTARRAAAPAQPPLGAILLVLLVSAVAALFATRMTLTGAVVLVFALAALAATYRWPQVAIFGFLAFTSSIVGPENFFLLIDPNLIYYAVQVFLLVLVVGAIRMRMREGEGAFQDFYSSPVAVALLVLTGVVFIKSMVFLIESRFAQWALIHVYTFNRSLTLFALFIPVYLLFNTARRQRLFLNVVFAIGSVIALRVVIETIFPELGIFRWISLKESLAVDFPNVDPSVLRLRAPGGSLVQICFWMGVMNLILRPWNGRRLLFYLPLTGLMLTAVLVEFNRSYVVPLMVLVLVALMLNQRGSKAKLLTLLAVIAVGTVLLSMSSESVASYVDAMAERYGSAFSEETYETQSLNSRTIENDYAWDSIRSAPIFGIGINELYRPPVPGLLDNLRWYIHNAFLWFWVYYGFVGLAALLLALAVAVGRGFYYWKKVTDPFLQAGLLALVFTLLTLSAASFYAPRFYEHGTVPVIAVIFGMIEAIIYASRRARAPGDAGHEAGTPGLSETRSRDE